MTSKVNNPPPIQAYGSRPCERTESSIFSITTSPIVVSGQRGPGAHPGDGFLCSVTKCNGLGKPVLDADQGIGAGEPAASSGGDCDNLASRPRSRVVKLNGLHHFNIR